MSILYQNNIVYNAGFAIKLIMRLKFYSYLNSMTYIEITAHIK